jgi:putative flippase GtrA
MIRTIHTLLGLKPMRFLLVGGLNTVVGYSLFALLLFLGLQSHLALLFTTCFGIVFNFRTISNMVFTINNNALFYKFFLLYAGLYLGNLGLLKLFDNLFHNPYYSGIISIVLITIPSYYGNKRLFSTTDVIITHHIN